MEIPTGRSAPISPKQVRTSALVQNLIIVAVAALLWLPCLAKGLPPNGDAYLHATYYSQFSRQFWSGEIYPRWMMTANKGYGSPIFLIQYPLPYWGTALLRPLVRFASATSQETRELGIFGFLVLAAAGLNARLWFQRNHTPVAATAGAIVYVSLPHLLAFDLYNNLALGESAIFAWMPLAFAACDVCQLRFRPICTLGIAWALMILTNLLTTLLFVPLLFAYAVARTGSEKKPLGECIASMLLSVAIGTGLAAVYLFPFAAYLRLFEISHLLNLPGYELSHHFGFLTLPSLGKPRVVIALVWALTVTGIAARSFWRAGGSLALRASVLLTLGLGALMVIPGFGLSLVSLARLKAPIFEVADYFPEKLLAMGLLTVSLGVFAYARILEDRSRPRDHTTLFHLLSACGLFMLMLPWSAFLWKAVPVAGRAVQFPHRLGVLLTVSVAGLVTAAIDGWWRDQENSKGRRMLFGMTTAVIACGLFTWAVDRTWITVLGNPPLVHPVETHDVDLTYVTFVSSDHLAGFARLIGAAPSGDHPQPTLVRGGTALLVQGQGPLTVTRESPRKLSVSYSLPSEGRARIGVVYSPLWRIKWITQPYESPALASSAEGLLEVPLVPGRHEFELVFDGGRPERLGIIVTFFSIAAVAAGLLTEFVHRLRLKKKALPTTR